MECPRTDRSGPLALRVNDQAVGGPLEEGVACAAEVILDNPIAHRRQRGGRHLAVLQDHEELRYPFKLAGEQPEVRLVKEVRLMRACSTHRLEIHAYELTQVTSAG